MVTHNHSASSSKLLRTREQQQRSIQKLEGVKRGASPDPVMAIKQQNRDSSPGTRKTESNPGVGGWCTVGGVVSSSDGQ
eukprot:9713880-Heterocapsa_arctica.AAC.1